MKMVVSYGASSRLPRPAWLGESRDPQATGRGDHAREWRSFLIVHTFKGVRVKTKINKLSS